MLPAVLDIPRLLAVSALIVLLLRRHVNLGLVMIIAAVVLGLLFELTPLRILEVVSTMVVPEAAIVLVASATTLCGEGRGNVSHLECDVLPG